MHVENDKKAFIFGASDLALLLQANLINLGQNHVESFVVDGHFIHQKELLGLPVVDAKELQSRYSSDEYACYVCLGYNNMNKYREKVHTRLLDMGYSILNFIHPTAQVNCLSLGLGNLFFQNVLVDFFTEIGSGNIFYPNSLVAHHNTVGNFNFFSVSSCVTGHVTIENGCFIGANSTIGNNVTLADHSLVGAGAYVSSSSNAYDVIVPARSAVLADKKSTDFF